MVEGCEFGKESVYCFPKWTPSLLSLLLFSAHSTIYVPPGFTSHVVCLLLRRKGRDEREWFKFSKPAQDSRQRQQAAPTYLASPGDRNKVFLNTEQKGRRSNDVLWHAPTSSLFPLLIQICRLFQQSAPEAVIMCQFWVNHHLRSQMKKWIGHSNKIQISRSNDLVRSDRETSIKMWCNILDVEL